MWPKYKASSVNLKRTLDFQLLECREGLARVISSAPLDTPVNASAVILSPAVVVFQREMSQKYSPACRDLLSRDACNPTSFIYSLRDTMCQALPKARDKQGTTQRQRLPLWCLCSTVKEVFSLPLETSFPFYIASCHMFCLFSFLLFPYS